MPPLKIEGWSIWTSKVVSKINIYQCYFQKVANASVLFSMTPHQFLIIYMVGLSSDLLQTFNYVGMHPKESPPTSHYLHDYKYLFLLFFGNKQGPKFSKRTRYVLAHVAFSRLALMWSELMVVTRNYTH